MPAAWLGHDQRRTHTQLQNRMATSISRTEPAASRHFSTNRDEQGRHDLRGVESEEVHPDSGFAEHQ